MEPHQPNERHSMRGDRNHPRLLEKMLGPLQIHVQRGDAGLEVGFAAGADVIAANQLGDCAVVSGAANAGDSVALNFFRGDDADLVTVERQLVLSGLPSESV